MKHAVIPFALAATLTTPAAARIVPAWTASQQRVWGSAFIFPTNIPPALRGKALRQIVRLGIGGRSARIVLSNAYGVGPLTLSAASIAPSRSGSRIDGAVIGRITFGGDASVTIAPGATLVSDPMPMRMGAGQDIAVTLTFASPPTDSFHWDGKRTGYVIDAASATAANPDVRLTTTARLALAGVLVDAPDAVRTVVALGDSITDGAGATLDADTRWPDLLAKRAAPRGIAVVNAGISGARLLSDGMGSNALARFDRDVAAQPGVRTLILLLGINDIAWPGTPFDPSARMPTFDAMTTGYKAIAARAHANGIRIIGATLPPFAEALPGTPLHATYYSPAKDVLRRRVNAWIRSSGTFDAVIDYDRILRDPSRVDHLATAYDSGDHLHPGDIGNRAMADAIDLDILIGVPRP